MFFFQGRYCNPECQREHWEQHRAFCEERQEQREACAGEGAGGGDGGGEGDGEGEGGGGGEGDEERQKAEEEWREEMERCRRAMLEAFPMSEVD